MAAAASSSAGTEGGDVAVAGSGAAAGTAEGGKKAGGTDGLVVKIGLVGDSGIGKTSLMVRYVEKRFDQDYVETLGVNFMEKTVPTDETEVTMSIWDLGGDRTYLSMLPMVCVDAVAMVFMFDLTQITSLSHIRDWFKQVRGHNAAALPFLVGTKYDLFYAMEKAEQEEIVSQARKYAKAMHAPLIFCSASHGINVQKLFKLIFQLVFSLPPDIEKKHDVGDALFEY